MTRLGTSHSLDRSDTNFLIGAIVAVIVLAVLLGLWLGLGKVLWIAASTFAVLLVIGLLLDKVGDSG